MSIRKGSSIIAGNIGQNVDSTLSPTSDNPVKNSVIYDALRNTLSTDDITNCITEIPQDIKLELNNGTLTLKAGSKVYVPNGSGVFDEVVIANDISSNSFAGSIARFVFIDINNNTINAASAVFSGQTSPTLSGVGFWYDTVNNIIRRTTDSGATWTTGYSFPIAIVTSVSDVATNINQTFNGFGYIGSVVFLLPGVTGVFPNGKNEDGTLRNLKVTSESVVIKNFTNLFSNPTLFDYVLRLTNYNGTWKLDLIEPAINDTYTYNSEENYWYYYTTKSYYCPFARVLHDKPTNDSKILSFSGKQIIKIIDSSDTSFIAHQAMPSDRYIDMTLGASGSSYTAPADGYFTYMDNSSSFGLACLVNQTNGLTNGINALSSTWVRRVFLPAKKGDIVNLIYENGGTNQIFRFIYAQGAV